MLHAQDLQQIANTLPVPKEIPTGQKKLQIPKVSGVNVKFLGADYEEIISANGVIQPVLSDVVVRVSFEVTKGKEKAISHDYPIVIQRMSDPQGPNKKPTVIPELLQWSGSTGEFSCLEELSISGASPELIKELNAMIPGGLKRNDKAKKQIALTRNADYKKSLGLGEEGYQILIQPDGIRIVSGTEKGLYWGTRSLLQMIKVGGGKIPCGEIKDFPRFAIRGFMFDAARTPFPLEYLEDIVDTMSWYKMNDFHVNLNNNYIFHEKYVDMGKDPFKESYSGYRLESDYVNKDGVTLHNQDLHYTKKEFSDFIKASAKKGVAIVPEINSPAHALSFTRMRPDLIYQAPMGGKEKRRCEMLDATNPETLKFVASVLDEYLLKNKELGHPVFEDLVIHVGADEFYGAAEDYRAYTDSILKYIKKRGYQPRLWGSLNQKKGKTPVLAKGVQLNLWNGGWARAWDSINQGYDIINTNDGALYIVPYADYYRMDKNQKWVYSHFEPNRIADEVVPSGHPQFLGATFAVWNDMIDMDHPGYHYRDIEGVINSSIDIVAQKTWGSVAVPRSFEEHRKLVETIGHTENAQKQDIVHHSMNLTGPETTGLPILAPPYVMEAVVELSETAAGKEQVLLSDGKAAVFAAMADGRVGFRRDDTLTFAYDYKLPLGKPVKMKLVGSLGKTQLFVDDKLVAEQPKLITFESRHKEKVSTFPLPRKEVGKSFNGTVKSLHIRPE